MPIAGFTVTSTGLSVTLDTSSSSFALGQIDNYIIEWGDGQS